MNNNRKQISHREMIDTSVGLMYVCMLSWCCVDTDNVTQQMRFLCREIVVGSAAMGQNLRICSIAKVLRIKLWQAVCKLPSKRYYVVTWLLPAVASEPATHVVPSYVPFVNCYMRWFHV